MTSSTRCSTTLSATPRSVTNSVPSSVLARTKEATMAELAKVSNVAPATQEKASPLLDQIVDEGRFTRDPERGRDLVKEFVDQVVQGHMAMSKETETSINERMAEVE